MYIFYAHQFGLSRMKFYALLDIQMPTSGDLDECKPISRNTF